MQIVKIAGERVIKVLDLIRGAGVASAAGECSFVRRGVSFECFMWLA